MKFLVFISIFCLGIAHATKIQVDPRAFNDIGQVEDRYEADFEAVTSKLEIEEKGNYPGMSAILGAAVQILESIVAFVLGRGSVDDIVSAIQGVFTQIEKMISIQGLVGQIPMFGFILQPLVGIAAMILSNAPLLGGVLSFILVGPSSD